MHVILEALLLNVLIVYYILEGIVPFFISSKRKDVKRQKFLITGAGMCSPIYYPSLVIYDISSIKRLLIAHAYVIIACYFWIPNLCAVCVDQFLSNFAQWMPSIMRHPRFTTIRLPRFCVVGCMIACRAPSLTGDIVDSLLSWLELLCLYHMLIL